MFLNDRSHFLRIKAVVVLLVAAALPCAVSYEEYLDRCPNGQTVGGGLGHTSSSGRGARNSFGNAFSSASRRWTTSLCLAGDSSRWCRAARDNCAARLLFGRTRHLPQGGSFKPPPLSIVGAFCPPLKSPQNPPTLEGEVPPKPPHLTKGGLRPKTRPLL